VTHITRSFSLTVDRSSGISCSRDGLHLEATPLLERSAGPDDAAQWLPRPIDDLNRELSGRYGLPVDIGAKCGGLNAVSGALNRGDIAHAQIAALHLRLPEPPALAKRSSVEDIIDLARQLAASGLLKAYWDEAKHPRWPAGSPDSTGGEFAPAGGADAPRPDATAGAVSSTLRQNNTARTLHVVPSVDRAGEPLATFIVLPPSKAGGVIVQKIVSTDTVNGAVVEQLVGWEAWPVAPGDVATNDPTDDTWKAPPPDETHPSVATVRTITGEARFYEGVTEDDLVNKYGFSIGGSGFSGELLSTKVDPNLPTDNATPPVKRTQTVLKW
jgi:hypothetical protein